MHPTNFLMIVYIFIIGKFTSLEKPYAVMKKRVQMLEDGEDEDNVTETSYDVEAVVKNKIIFKNRPRPIIVKPQAKKI